MSCDKIPKLDVVRSHLLALATVYTNFVNKTTINTIIIIVQRKLIIS